MDKDTLKNIRKCTILGIIWAILLVAIAFLIISFKNYNLKDMLFIEGIAFVAFGILSCIGGNPLGLSIQGLGQNNAQYISNSNLEVTKLEKANTKNIKNTLSIGLSTISLVFAGILVITINFII